MVVQLLRCVDPYSLLQLGWSSLFVKVIMDDPIAIVGIACVYPGASDTQHLWENALSKRRQFRDICEQRMSEKYFGDPSDGDSVYQKRAALVDGFKYDWLGKRVPLSSFKVRIFSNLKLPTPDLTLLFSVN
jgi:hypothetical protein